MVWETVKNGASKAASFQSWPNPVNAIVDIKVLMCNQDYWVAEVEFIAATIVQFFWTQFFPSPRELERKALLGGYKCGFYLDEGFRSPLEVIWGKDTQRVLVEISEPFTTGLFYIWAASAIIDALAAWQTIMWPQLFCDPFQGNYKYSGAHAEVTGGHTEGGVGLGHLDYDPNGYGNPFVADMVVPAGTTRMNVFWTFNAGALGCTDLKTGFQIDSTYLEIEDYGAVLPFTNVTISREMTYDSTSGYAMAPWFSADCPFLGGFNVMSAVRVIGDHHTIPPDPKPPSVERPPHGHRPRCAGYIY